VVEEVEIGPLDDTFPVDIEATSSGKISVFLYRKEVAIATNSYSITSCTSYSWQFVQFPVTLPTGTRTWRLIKTGEKLVFYCNGENVLEFVFSESSYNPGCSDNWTGEQESVIKFNNIDTASMRFRS
jgi:hypothetical protein